jgi:hypothetical protein
MHPTAGPFYTNSNEPQTVLDALRSMLSEYPQVATVGPETLSELLYERRFLSHQPEVFEVEAALEALRIEGEVLP